MYEALLRDRRLDLAYQKRGQTGQVTYVVHPLGIVSRGHVVYLVCTLFNFDDVRLLAMHRIRSAEVEEEAARRPKDFDLDAYIESGAWVSGEVRPLGELFAIRKQTDVPGESAANREVALQAT